MAYLRPNLILVYDRLASSIPRQWEWNIHAVNSMNVISDRRISVAVNGQSLCVDMLAGPTMSFAQTNLFTVDPSSGGFRQWHGNFHSVELLGAAEFIALLNVGCTPTVASASKADGVWTVPLGDSTITIAADGSITVSDTSPPTVAITAPASGATVSGMISVTASASDNFGVAGVQFKSNGANFGAENTTPPYSVTGDTTTVPNGMYTLTAVARDAAGNRTTSAPVTVTVFNDLSPPTVAITSPASGDTVSGTARQRSGWSHLCSANVYQTASHYSSLPRNKWITECTDRFYTSLYRGQLLSQRKWKTDSYQTALWFCAPT